MEAIKSILKGMVIGIANIIPGVSGGTMMVAMGIYDKLIHCITHLFKEFKESLKFVFPILVGAAIAYIRKEKKKGVRCIGCPAGGTCSGNCSGCHSDTKEKK